MVDVSASLENGRVTSPSSVAEVLTAAARKSSKTATSESGGRTVSDSVDLSDIAKMAADFKESGDVDQLTASLKQARQITDNFVAQFKSEQSDSSSTTDFGTALNEEVTAILREGKPASIIDRMVKRLFG